LEVHQNSYNYITNTIVKILMWESSDTKEGPQRWLKCVTQAAQRQVSPNIFGWLMWPTLFIICNLLGCHWILLIKIFSMVLMMLSSEFWCVSEIILFYFYFFIFPDSSQITRRREERKKIRKKKTSGVFWRSDDDTTGIVKNILIR